MEDLFNKLKTEAPVNHYIREPPPYIERSLNVGDDSLSAEPKNNSCLSPRRDSMPPPSSAVVIKKANKSRSLSPPKLLAANFKAKSFKVCIERKSFEGLLAQDLSQKPLKRHHKFTAKNSTDGETKKMFKASQKPSLDVVKMMTPTKAQQKLFDPAVLKKAQILKEFQVKRCLVRLQRNNLKKLQKELEIRKSANIKEINKEGNKSPPAEDRKRKSSNTADDYSSKRKRGRPSLSSVKDRKTKQSSFFIKLTASPPMASSASKLSAKLKIKKHDVKRNKQAEEKLSKKQIVKSPKSTTAATKFTRSQLIKAFGKRPFQSRVKIERCTHPLMIIFESNARARKLQSKRNKSKNLSVSFREQVEIFGDSDEESDTDSSSGSINLLPSTSQAALSKSAAATPLLPVMPARLKKVENGKVIDDIELDTSLFIDPASSNSSTPYPTAARKKREKKSYSPLKDDGTPSPRKERLKMANEKMPPSGLRRLNIDDIDDEDDEDDECEYIVPTEVPQRRISRTSSTNASDQGPDMECDLNGSALTVEENKDTTDSSTSLHRGLGKVGEVTGNEGEDSCSSFVSAEGQPHVLSSDNVIAKESNETKMANNKNASLLSVEKPGAACDGTILSNMSRAEKPVEEDETGVSISTPIPVIAPGSEEKCVANNLSQCSVLSPVVSLNCLDGLVDNILAITETDGESPTNKEENTTEESGLYANHKSLTGKNKALSMTAYVEDEDSCNDRSENFDPADSIVESFVNETPSEL